MPKDDHHLLELREAGRAIATLAEDGRALSRLSKPSKEVTVRLSAKPSIIVASFRTVIASASGCAYGAAFGSAALSAWTCQLRPRRQPR